MKRLIGKTFPNDMSPLAGMLPLFEQDMIPQQVTARYTTSLLIRGKNEDFELISLEHQQALHDSIVVGSYYNVTVRKPLPDHSSEIASGVTPHQAIERALTKFGVTFR